MKRILLAYLCLFSLYSNAQNMTLTDISSNLGAQTSILDQKILPSGRIVTVGSFGGSFFPDPANTSIGNSPTGATDGFIVVYNADGSYLWSHIFSGSAEDAVTTVEVSNGVIYVAGYVTTTTPVDIDPTGAVNNLYSTTSFKDGFVIAYSELGTAVNFATKVGGNGQDTPQRLALSGANLIVGGQFNNTIDLDGGSGTADFTSTGSPGNYDFFLASLNATTGAYLNGYTAGEDNDNISGVNEEQVFDIVSNGTNVFALVRWWSSGVVPIPVGNGVNLPTTPNGFKTVLLKFDATLTPIAATFNNLEYHVPHLMRLDAGILATVGDNYYSDNLKFNLILESNLTAFQTYTTPTTTFANIRASDVSSYNNSPSDYGFYFTAWKNNGSIDIDGTGSLPAVSSANGNTIKCFVVKTECSSGNFNFQWLEEFGETNINTYSSGLATRGNTLALTGIVNGTTSFDPFNQTANASNSINTSSFVPYFGLYSTCISPSAVVNSPTDLQVCYTGDIDLQAQGAAPIEWYDQASGGNLLTTGNNYSLNNVQGSTTVYLQNSCSSTRIPVQIQLVSPAAPLIVGPTSQCSGDSVTLSLFGTIDPILTDFNWNINGGPAFNTTTSPVTVSGNSNYNVNFFASNPIKGCGTSTTYSISLIALDPIDAEMTPVCVVNPGDLSTMTFDVNFTNTSANYTSFSWTGASITGGPYTGSSFIWNDFVNTMNPVICTSVDNITGCTNSDTVDIVYNLIPEHSVTGTCTELFLGEPLLANETIVWTDGNGNTGTNVTFPIDPTTQQYEIVVTNGDCQYNGQYNVELPSANETTIVANGNQLAVIEENYNYEFQWIDCNTGDEITDEQSANFTPIVGGNYAVIVDNRFGCIDTSNCITSTIGLDELNSQQFEIYPNPATTTITLSINHADAIIIRDMNGKTIKTVSNYAGGEINLLAVEAGVYFVDVINENQHITQKLIIN